MSVLYLHTPYMLRNDGECIEVSIGIHPYILPADGSCDYNDIRELFDAPDMLEWVYVNSNLPSVRQDIRILVKSVIATGDISIDWDTPFDSIANIYTIFGIDNGTPSLDSWDKIYKLASNLNYNVNQEFCRIRTSDMYTDYGSNDGCIYFRILSHGFNWFDLIWQIVYDNRNKYDSVTIVRDDTEKIYKINGKRIDHYPIDDFITLSGKPVVENKATKRINIERHRSKIMENKAPKRIRYKGQIYEAVESKPLKGYWLDNFVGWRLFENDGQPYAICVAKFFDENGDEHKVDIEIFFTKDETDGWWRFDGNCFIERQDGEPLFVNDDGDDKYMEAVEEVVGAVPHSILNRLDRM